MRLKDWRKKLNETAIYKQKAKASALEKINQINEGLAAYRSGNDKGIGDFFATSLNHLPKVSHESLALSVTCVNSALVVDYLLPRIEELKETPVSAEAKQGEITIKYIRDADLFKVYNKLVYDIVLAVIHNVYKYDEGERIENVTVNGILDSVDRSIGRKVRICACSLQLTREEFGELDFNLIDSYECFRRYKGVSVSNIADEVPVRPIVQNQNDSRFVEGYNVASEIKRGTNLATIPWQDFENLIRELFEKLFRKHGGSCRVTRASRDGGVDAIAFNPDPISGGKIVVQAKRYTNLVSPSAVRDLYGALLHEGANKAILVTTSDYGKDAYAWAKGKPIELLNGSHLLYYLKEELGMMDVYINVEEAKNAMIG